MARINIAELDYLAEKAGLSIQHDCGGYRVVEGKGNYSNTYLYPDGGICPTATRHECAAFLKGFIMAKQRAARFHNANTK